MATRRSAPASLGELRQRYLVEGAPLPAGLIASLEGDSREGAQKLVTALKKRQAENRAEGQRLRHMLKFEKELWAEGYVHIAGVDEAGMGPCAGPVCAGAAILPQGYKLKGLDDSKKILDEDERLELAEAVKRDALAWAIGWAQVEEIDTINIYQAGLLAMRRAVEGLKISPHYVLVDARKIPGITQPQRGIIKGDAQSLSIAAGAILAKTTRDTLMAELDAKHPGYGFASHKGYPTPVHLEAMDRLGVLDFHRRSFAPVRKALGLEPTQQELF
ncbi:MAG: ribonuclease HII [Archangium gephyra]|uniref:Ribonuclease HII n=1 Tax=Archangium gephyra TaxID=48 RepID=A0A2W5TZ82_9BACT|nr:MAG: ribonuclease HII [Archangium gephyra]